MSYSQKHPHVTFPNQSVTANSHPVIYLLLNWTLWTVIVLKQRDVRRSPKRMDRTVQWKRWVSVYRTSADHWIYAVPLQRDLQVRCCQYIWNTQVSYSSKNYKRKIIIFIVLFKAVEVSLLIIHQKSHFFQIYWLKKIAAIN